MSDEMVQLVGVDGTGSRCVETVLEHGAAPREALASAGWDARELVSIDRSTATVELTFRVRRAPRRPAPPRAPRVDVSADLAGSAVRRQRVAAYALVNSRRGMLLTEYSDKTARPGAWGLPGGGVDPQEPPDAAVLREVWEESGQEVTLDSAWDVLTDHWVGPAPDGRVEDFHAVRLIYRAHCDRPTDPVVHDVGGTTRSAAWWQRTQTRRLDLIPWTRALLAETSG